MDPRDFKRSAAGSGARLAALLACAAALVCAAPAAASASARVDLGAPNYTGYCQSLGYVSSVLTTQSPKQWACSHADGTISLMDVQAACEYSFTRRPIVAEQLSPGVAYTWQCYTTPTSGGAGSGHGKSHPTATQLSASLLAALVPRGHGARISVILGKGGYALLFHALTAGTVLMSWYVVPNGAHVATAKAVPTLVASGRRSFSSSGVLSLKIRLTATGTRLLRHAAHIKLTVKGVFTPGSGSSVVLQRAFTLIR